MQSVQKPTGGEAMGETAKICAVTLEAGHKFIASLELDDAQKAVLRANCVGHRRYKYDVKSSVFRDVPEVCEVLRMPTEYTEPRQ